MKFLIIFFIALLPGISYSATITKLDLDMNIIEIRASSIPEEMAVEGYKKFLFFEDDIPRWAKVEKVISKTRVVLYLRDIDGLKLGMKLSFTPAKYKNDEKMNIFSSESFTSNSSSRYEFSTSGFRKYLRTELYYDNKAIYEKLNRELTTLERRSNFGDVMVVSGILVGGVMMAIGTSVLEDDKASADNKDEALSIWLKGVGIGLGILVVGFVIKPNEDQMIGFIKKHNKLNQKNKLNFFLKEKRQSGKNQTKIYIGSLFGKDSLAMMLSYSF